MGLALGTDTVIDRLKRELHRMVDILRGDLDRIEILVGALNGFSRPVPDYEPGFQHLPQFKLDAHELSRPVPEKP